ncbi:MAG: potassium channel family protein [Gaiellaceae bacterium]
MYVLIAGGGKVGANVARTLLGLGHEVTIIDQRPERFRVLEEEFDYRVQRGDATELHVLERAGIGRPPNLVLAVTGDDEDNIVICEIARSRYHVPKVIARVNDPRNQEHFDLLGIAPTVCATSSILGLIEHEVPEHDLSHLLQLRNDDLEIVEVPIAANSPSAWKRVEQLDIPAGARLVSVARDGESAIAQGATELRPGDRVIAILQPGCEQALRDVLLKVKR